MTDFWYFALPLLTGLLLDTIIGDPDRMPHPIKLFGNLIAFFDKRLNETTHKRIKGAAVAIVLVASVWITLYGIEVMLSTTPWLYISYASVMVFYGIANRNLIDEALKVERKLTFDGIEAGRKQLSRIVGRDTSQLSANKIRIAVLETLSENLSDGVIAPLFYYALGGVPLMFAYKMVNTLDSMIGYKSEKYIDFGRFAAKLDDVANFIPSRLTAFVMVFISLSWRGLTYIFHFGKKHASPNSGYPEAALAGILNCRFGGPNIYHGQVVEKPFIGYTDREITKGDIIKACVLNGCVTVVMVVAVLFLR